MNWNGGIQEECEFCGAARRGNPDSEIFLKIGVDNTETLGYYLYMNNTNAVASMTFEEFAKLYRATFATMMTYSMEQVGSAIYVEKLAELLESQE